MGKGDQRSKRGKIHRGTFGKRRPKPKTHKPGVAAVGASEGQAASSAKTKEPKIVKKQPKE
ncbi:MAG: 30S ribosomal protein THX [Pyrinomonadaceae bacterium]